MHQKRLRLYDHLLILLVTGAVVLIVGVVTAACGSRQPEAMPAVRATALDNLVDTTVYTNLYIEQDATIADDLTVADDTTLTDDLAVGGDLAVTADLTVGDELTVTTSISTAGDIQVGDDITLAGNIYLPDGVWNGIQAGNVVFGDGQDATIMYTSDYLQIYSAHDLTLAVPATGTLSLDSGSLAIGNGTPTVALDGEDTYFEGTFEVDGTAYFDGQVEIDSRLTIMDAGEIAAEDATNEGVVFVVTSIITYSTDGTPVTAGVIPLYADVVDWAVVVETAFDDSGADLLTCGISGGDTDKYVDDLDVSATGRNAAGDANDMQLDEWSTSFGDVGGADVTIVCQYDGANSDANNGSATFIIWWALR